MGSGYQQTRRYLINDSTGEFKEDNLPPLGENFIGTYQRYE